MHIPNGVDPQLFVPREVERAPFWRQQLVGAPQGWAPGGEPGSVAYTDADMAPFERGAPVLLYVGRFTNVKRVPLLIEAHTRARDAYATPAPLVLVGGFPGEWEGEHPLTTIRRTGAPDVFLAGWHDHHELPWLLAAGDAVVLPSMREQFGQVLVEGMACGLPAIAINAHGPAEIIHDGKTGWLVEDDLDSLAAALVDAVNHPHERRRRGHAAARDTRRRFGWPALTRRVAAVYAQVAASRTADRHVTPRSAPAPSPPRHFGHRTTHVQSAQSRRTPCDNATQTHKRSANSRQRTGVPEHGRAAQTRDPQREARAPAGTRRLVTW